MSPGVVRALNALGYDALDQRDVLPAGSGDREVMSRAHQDGRIVVARDFDMAELALRGFAPAAGVIVVAFDFIDPATEAARLDRVLRSLGAAILGSVLVIEASRVRGPRPILI